MEADYVLEGSQDKTITLEVRRPMEAITEQDCAISRGSQAIMYAYGVSGSVANHCANLATKRVLRVIGPSHLYLSLIFLLIFQLHSLSEIMITWFHLYAIAAESIIGEKAHHMLIHDFEVSEFIRDYTRTQNFFA